MACGTIRGYTTNNYYINVVYIQIVQHWGTNQECSIINRGNTVQCIVIKWISIWRIVKFIPLIKCGHLLLTAYMISQRSRVAVHNLFHL